MLRLLSRGILVVAVAATCLASGAGAQIFPSAVGGVSVDADGVLEAPTQAEEEALAAARARIDLGVPKDLEKYEELRAVSLKWLEASIAQATAEGKDVPAAVAYVAGLQRVRYVFAFPERGDVVLVGPAEGWKIDRLGNVVGATTNRPVILLDDLLAGLRSGAPSRLEPITCSIDPSPEGLARAQALFARMSRMGDPDETATAVEEALGPQRITVTGIPATSRFARTMVAADFRMKRIAMGFEPAPVGGLPSFVQMMSGRSATMTPRWWLAPSYEPLAQTADGLSWELRGPGVKCLSESEFVAADGQRQRTGQSDPLAAKWAAMMTAAYEELAAHDSTFGQLRNLMDLAVVGALVEREQMFERAGLDAPQLRGELPLARFAAATQTSSKATLLKKGRNWIVTASGGVEMLPWQIVEKHETVAALAEVREKFAAANGAY
ncbi:MAG: DUF1598 domain-containing protein [Pirellulales bacterium]|nr:DUF1598 domain-containing protein [Pirellulales bacterium]